MKTETPKAELRERFVELRAEGRSYNDCAELLTVSKPTLLAWARELQAEIANAKALRLDTLFELYLVGKAKRVETFGKRLQAILTELDKRDLADVPTPLLLKLALDYGQQLRDEAEPITLAGKPEPSFDVLPMERPHWPA